MASLLQSGARGNVTAPRQGQWHCPGPNSLVDLLLLRQLSLRKGPSTSVRHFAPQGTHYPPPRAATRKSPSLLSAPRLGVLFHVRRIGRLLLLVRASATAH